MSEALQIHLEAAEDHLRAARDLIDAEIARRTEVKARRQGKRIPAGLPAQPVEDAPVRPVTAAEDGDGPDGEQQGRIDLPQPGSGAGAAGPDLPEGATEKVGGVAGACSAFVMRREPDANASASGVTAGETAPLLHHPAADKGPLALAEHLTRLPKVPGWTLQDDAWLIRLLADRWDFQMIMQEMGREARDVRSRINALTDNRRFSPAQVQSALREMEVQNG